MIEELWQQVTNRRRNTYNDMFNQAHDIPHLTLEEREKLENRWILPDEPEQADRDMVKKYDFEKKPDAWEEFETEDWDWKEWKNKTDWRLKDVSKREEYALRSGRVNAYDGKKNWQETRLLPIEYYARKEEIEKDGLPKMLMFPQLTNGLHSIQVLFPRGFQHLTNQEGQRRKWNTDARYHISLGYEPRWGQDGKQEDDKGFKKALYEFYDDYFKRIPGKDDWDWEEMGLGKKFHVTSGATYELQGEDDEFIKRMNELARWGTGKSWAHISLD
jgi:hypothetical protein